jgi:hypothetical protein
MKPFDTIQAFDQFIAARGLYFEGIVVGGTALALLGVVSRTTRDCDVLAPAIPEPIRLAAIEFARRRSEHGDALADDWLNNGPQSLANALPEGWKERLQVAFQGKGIVLHSPGRLDLLRSKLFALCDRGSDLPDCIALEPTEEELNIIAPWLRMQDGNPDWPSHVQDTLDDLRRRLRHGV